MANLSGFDNYFALFHLKPSFKIDRGALETSYLAVQKEVHPDMHASKSDAEKRVSMQLATLANTAYRTLLNPIERGLYLCRAHGVDPQLETNTAMPADFLMQQMVWRETLDDAQGDMKALMQLQEEVEQAYRSTMLEVEQLIDEQSDYQGAATQLRALLFIHKFNESLEEALLD